MDQQIRIEFSKIRGEARKLGQLKHCFYYKDSECHKQIIQAHSIQENGRLSLIESDVNGCKTLYSFNEIISDDENSPFNSLTVGKAKASTFTGFCKTHDALFFSKIEGKNPYDKSSEHNFLHSYRSYAYSFHLFVTTLLSITGSEERLNNYIKRSGIQSLDLQMHELENHARIRSRLNTILENKTYDDLSYFVYTKKGKYLVAASTVVMPNFSISGKSMFNSALEAIPMMFTALPDKNESFVILTALKEHEMGCLFIEELKKLPSVQVERVLSSLLIQNNGNTFLSPVLWKALGKVGRRNLLEDLNKFKMLYAFNRKAIKGFIMNRINFYNKIFSGEYLNI
jgi:hypothetical protein